MKGVLVMGCELEELTSIIADTVLKRIANNPIPSEKVSKNTKEFLTREETAELCKIKSLSTLWNWKKQGLLAPSSRAGRKPLYKYEDVIEFLEGRKTGSDDK